MTQVANNYNDVLTNLQYSDDFIESIPDAITLDDEKLVLFWIRSQYIQHNKDSIPDQKKSQGAVNAVSTGTWYNITYATGVADYENGNNALSNVKIGGTNASLRVGTWLWGARAANKVNGSKGTSSTETHIVPSTFNFVAQVKTSSVGSLTLDRVISGTTGAGLVFGSSFSKYHQYSLPNSTSTDTGTNVVSSESNLIQSDATKMPRSLSELSFMADELFFAMMSHILDGNIHVSFINGDAKDTVNSKSNGASKSFVDSVTGVSSLNKPFFLPKVGVASYAS